MLRQLLISLILFTSTLTADEAHVKTILQSHFSTESLENAKIKLLQGGFSGIENYLIEIDQKKYVLKLHSELESPTQIRKELNIYQEASKANLTPKLVYASEDGSVLLMEYIDKHTLTLAEAKDPHNISKLAKGIHAIHQLPNNSISQPLLVNRTLSLYQYLQRENMIYPNELEVALRKMSQAWLTLRQFNLPLTTIHGDLNARNIFLTDDSVLFIDWSETNYDDPFVDLAFFTGQLDYSHEEENLFLEDYLGHTPTELDLKHFELAKRIEYAELACSLFYLSNVLSQKEGILLNTSEQPQEWSYYIHCFVGNNNNLSAQHFYNYAKCCLMLMEHAVN